jgi:hypothetical protein
MPYLAYPDRREGMRRQYGKHFCESHLPDLPDLPDLFGIGCKRSRGDVSPATCGISSNSLIR